MNNYFKVGDVVKMKSGNPEMTVIRLLSNDKKEDKFVFIDRFGYEEGDVICEWSDGDIKKCDIFRRTSLELVCK